MKLAIRSEFNRWMEAESGTWRAWTVHLSLLVVPIAIGLVLRACNHSA